MDPLVAGTLQEGDLWDNPMLYVEAQPCHSAPQRSADDLLNGDSRETFRLGAALLPFL